MNHPESVEDGTFPMWIKYYGALGPPHPKPGALEVVPQDHGGARKFSRRTNPPLNLIQPSVAVKKTGGFADDGFVPG